MERTTQDHPSFAMISASRVSGRSDLFGVDYPQEHYVTLTISRGKLERSLGHDWFYQGEPQIEVAMSEVQWARMLSSMNTTGVPCTLTRERVDGKLVGVPRPPPHMADAEKMKDDVREQGDKIAAAFTEAQKIIDEMLAGGPPKKGDLQRAKAELRAASAMLTSALPFYVDQAKEAVQKSVEHGKGEVSAFVAHTLQELGREVLGEKVRQGGVMVSFRPDAAQIEGPKTA